MKLFNKFLLGAALAFLASTPTFCSEGDLEEPTSFNVVEFVKSFLPEGVDNDYIEKVVNAYEHSLRSKREILHEGYTNSGNRSIVPMDTVIRDYGWNFPPVPRIQRHLLEFLTSQEENWMLDVGAGFGFDSLFSLLTGNVNILAIEKQEPQCAALKITVKQSILQNIDSNFPVDRKFAVRNEDIPNQHECTLFRV